MTLLFSFGVVASEGLVRADAGTEQEGYNLGLGNGGIMARRIRYQTLDRQGCWALSQFQDTIVRVLRVVRSPQGRSDLFVRGFYRGYSGALRQAIHEARANCRVEAFNSGDFPGQFSGQVFCQVLADAPETLRDYPFQSLYSGWAAPGDDDVRASCRAEFAGAVNACAGSTLAEIMGVAQQQVCL